MAEPIRAIYTKGQLRLLTSVDLVEGQTVHIAILPDQTSTLPADEIDARLRAAGLLLEMNIPEDAVELTPDERERIGRRFVGDRPSEDLISEERGTY